MVDYTTRIRAEKQDTGSNQNTWGGVLNTDVFDMFDEAFGVETVALTGINVTLSTADGSTDQARNMGLRFTGTGGVTVTIPSVEKMYFVINDSDGTVTIDGGGTTTAFAAGEYGWVATDGTDTYRDGPTLDKIPAPAADLSLNSNKLTNLANGTANTDALTKLQIDNAIAAATTSSTPGTLKVTATDTTAKFLNSAIVAGTNLTSTVNNSGGNETLTLDVDLTNDVSNGLTGATSFTDAGVLVGNGTGAIQATSAGTSGQVLTSNGAGVDPTFQDLSVLGGSTETSTGTTVTLTSASTRVQAITPSADLTVALPDATTLDEGTPIFVIQHAGSTNTILVTDNAGGLIAQLTTGEILTCSLVDNSAAAGTWARFEATGPSGFVNTATDVFESATTTNITAAQLTTDKVIIGYRDDGNSSRPTAVVIDYSGASPVVGTPVVVAAITGDRNAISAINSTAAIMAYDDDTNADGRVVVLSVSGTTITVNTPEIFEAVQTTNNTLSVTVCSSTLAIVAYGDTGNSSFITACPIAISGTALTAGTPLQVEATAISGTAITALTSTTAFVTFENSGVGKITAAHLTESSGSLTADSTADIRTFANSGANQSVCALSPSRVLVFFEDDGITNDPATVVPVTMTGSVFTTVGSIVTVQTPSSGGTNDQRIIAIDADTAIAVHRDSTPQDLYIQQINWNGGTPTVSKQTSFDFGAGATPGISFALANTAKYVVPGVDGNNSNFGTALLIQEFV